MAKLCNGKPGSPKHAALPPLGLTTESLYDLITEHCTKVEDKVVMKDCISGLLEIISDPKQNISVMADKIDVMESDMLQRHVANGGMEQCQHCLCLHISGIELPSLGQNDNSSGLP